MHNVYIINTTVLYVFYRNAYRDAWMVQITLVMYVSKQCKLRFLCWMLQLYEQSNEIQPNHDLSVLLNYCFSSLQLM